MLGTIGGLRSTNKSTISLEEVKRTFREQLYVLLNEGVDGLLLETYYDFEELQTVLSIARKETTLPIIAHVTLHDIGVLQHGMPLAEALTELEQLGADVVGLNCHLGPYHMLRSLEEVPIPTRAFYRYIRTQACRNIATVALFTKRANNILKKRRAPFVNKGFGLSAAVAVRRQNILPPLLAPFPIAHLYIKKK